MITSKQLRNKSLKKQQMNSEIMKNPLWHLSDSKVPVATKMIENIISANTQN